MKDKHNDETFGMTDEPLTAVMFTSQAYLTTSRINLLKMVLDKQTKSLKSWYWLMNYLINELCHQHDEDIYTLRSLYTPLKSFCKPCNGTKKWHMPDGNFIINTFAYKVWSMHVFSLLNIKFFNKLLYAAGVSAARLLYLCLARKRTVTDCFLFWWLLIDSHKSITLLLFFRNLF